MGLSIPFGMLRYIIRDDVKYRIRATFNSFWDATFIPQRKKNGFAYLSIPFGMLQNKQREKQSNMLGNLSIPFGMLLFSVSDTEYVNLISFQFLLGCY